MKFRRLFTGLYGRKSYGILRAVHMAYMEKLRGTELCEHAVCLDVDDGVVLEDCRSTRKSFLDRDTLLKCVAVVMDDEIQLNGGAKPAEVVLHGERIPWDELACAYDIMDGRGAEELAVAYGKKTVDEIAGWPATPFEVARRKTIQDETEKIRSEIAEKTREVEKAFEEKLEIIKRERREAIDALRAEAARRIGELDG